jgi:hypothetical protein
MGGWMSKCRVDGWMDGRMDATRMNGSFWYSPRIRAGPWLLPLLPKLAGCSSVAHHYLRWTTLGGTTYAAAHGKQRGDGSWPAWKALRVLADLSLGKCQ